MRLLAVFLVSLVGLTPLPSSAQAPKTVSQAPKDVFIEKLRTAPPNTTPLECKGETVLKSPTNPYTEIIFYDGCKLLFDVPADNTCCIGLSADEWRFPDGVGSKYYIGFAASRAEDGAQGAAGAPGRDYNRIEPGGGGSRGGEAGNGEPGSPGKVLVRPKNVVFMITKGIFNQNTNTPLSADEIAKIDFLVNFSGAEGGAGGSGGAGGKGGDGEGGSNGVGSNNRACLVLEAHGAGDDPCPADRVFSCRSLGRPGGDGRAGGIGGIGGHGGDGSDGSNFELFSTSDVVRGIAGDVRERKSSWQLVVREGHGGQAGSSGNSGGSGLGGHSGQICGGATGGSETSPITPRTPVDFKGNEGRQGTIKLHAANR